MPDIFGPDIRNSVFAHVVHVLLIGGVVGYGWGAVKALVRKPTNVGRALRNGVNAAWMVVLLLVLTSANPLRYLSAAGTIAMALMVLALLDRRAEPEKNEELLTSGPAGVVGREGERKGIETRVQRG